MQGSLRLVGMVVLLVVLHGCKSDPITLPDVGAGDLQLDNPGPGFHRAVYLVNPPDAMYYSAHVPEVDLSGKVPLVLALHYAGESTPYFGEQYLKGLVEPAMRDLGAIVVAPDCPRGNWTSDLSLAILKSFVESLIRDWPVDQERVIITGYSKGGIATWHYADLFPELFSAAIPVGARPAPDPQGRTPMYVIHGSEDELFPSEHSSRAVGKLVDRGKAAVFVSADGLGHYEAFQYVDYLRQSIPWIKDIWAAG